MLWTGFSLSCSILTRALNRRAAAYGIFATAQVPEPVTSDASPVPEPATEPVTQAGGLPVEQAAAILRTSVNALKKRLRKGTIGDYKVESKHGETWFVAASEVQSAAPVQERVTGAEAPAPEPVIRTAEPVPEPLRAPIEVLLQRMISNQHKSLSIYAIWSES